MALVKPPNVVMQSTLGTSEVVIAPATTNQVGAFASAPDGKYVRVVINNIGATTILIGFAPSSVAAGSAAGNYSLLPGQQPLTVVLSPRQSLYATSGGALGRISFAISEALPVQVQ